MYVYTFTNELYPTERRIITTDFPVRDKELLEKLVNSMSYASGWWKLGDIITSNR